MIPNYRPNGWLDPAFTFCKGKTFLCHPTEPDWDKVTHWHDTLLNRMSGKAGGKGEIICLKIDCSKINLVSDYGENRLQPFECSGDYFTEDIIPPDRIKICRKKKIKPGWFL